MIVHNFPYNDAIPGASPQYSQGAAAGRNLGPSVEKASEIDQRVVQLECALDELRSLAAGFQVKLQNVLVPQMKAASQGTTEAPRAIASPLADRLDKIHGEWRHTSAMLRDIFERIAL